MRKEELDKWWDEQYDKERDQRFQKFANRMKFEGTGRSALESRKVAPSKSVIMKAPDGKIYGVDKSEVDEAKRHGWSIQ